MDPSKQVVEFCRKVYGLLRKADCLGCSCAYSVIHLLPGMIRPLSFCESDALTNLSETPR